VALRFARKAKIGLDDARERTITEFVRAVETKDPYTFRHSERVATIAVELHRELGGKARYLELRWSGGVLHDIGKVAVPAEILTKRAALTSEEFEAIKLHPGLGADVVDEIDSLRDLVPEIRHHHERMDGQGYPVGLCGEAIPYEARVLAVADAFEALTSDRPYRPGLTAQEALDELTRTAGDHHDPQIVAALRRVIAGGVSFDRPETLKIRAAPNAVDRQAVGQ
jgi:putative nucleotidyltransferase with HDIG domain